MTRRLLLSALAALRSGDIAGVLGIAVLPKAVKRNGRAGTAQRKRGLTRWKTVHDADRFSNE